MTRLYSFIISIFLFSWVLSAHAEGDYVYKKVTSNDEIVDGGTYVFVVNSNGSFWHYGTGFNTNSYITTTGEYTHLLDGGDFTRDNAMEVTINRTADGNKFNISTSDSEYTYYFHEKSSSGNYSLVINVSKPNVSYSSDWTIYIDDNDYANIYINTNYRIKYYSSNNYFRYSKSADDKPIYLYRKYSTKAQAEKVSVGEYGWGTLCCDKALDFSSTEIEAYLATLSGSELILTKADVVPANYPVILYHADGAKEEDVPISENNPETVATVLTGATDDFVVPSTGTYYVLSTLDGITGFYKAAAGTIIPKGKAYISNSGITTSSAKYLSFRLPTATTVTAPFELQSSDDAIYTITGQRVSSSYKGIVIKNKRKVIF